MYWAWSNQILRKFSKTRSRFWAQLGEIVFGIFLPKKAVLAETNYGSFLFLLGQVYLHVCGQNTSKINFLPCPIDRRFWSIFTGVTSLLIAVLARLYNDSLVQHNHFKFPSRFVHCLSRPAYYLSIVDYVRKNSFLIMTWHMIDSNRVHLNVFTWLVKVGMFWVCPLSIQVCPLSLRTFPLSIHSWLWNRTDYWLWPDAWSTVHVTKVYTVHSETITGWDEIQKLCLPKGQAVSSSY